MSSDFRLVLNPMANKKKSVQFVRKSNFNGIYSTFFGRQIHIKNRDVFETTDPLLIDFFDQDPEICRLNPKKVEEFNQTILSPQAKANIAARVKQDKEHQAILDSDPEFNENKK